MQAKNSVSRLKRPARASVGELLTGEGLDGEAEDMARARTTHGVKRTSRRSGCPTGSLVGAARRVGISGVVLAVAELDGPVVAVAHRGGARCAGRRCEV